MNNPKNIIDLNPHNQPIYIREFYETVLLPFEATCRAVSEVNRPYYLSQEWKHAADISYGLKHAAGILPDGSIIALGDNSFGQCNVSAWNNIVAVSCGKNHTVGLRADGTVIAAGSNLNGQCNVESWENIISVGTTYWQTVAAASDGSILDCGMNFDGPVRDIHQFHGIKKVVCGAYTVIGLRNDGKAMGTGGKMYNPQINEHIYGPDCDTSKWEDVIDVVCGKNHTVALKGNGLLYAGNVGSEHGQADILNIKNVGKIFANLNTSVLEYEENQKKKVVSSGQFKL